MIVSLVSLVVCGAAAPLHAAPRQWTVEFSAGAAAPTSDISSRLLTGWDVDVGLGYQLNSWFTLLGDFGFTGMGVPANVLQEFGAPDGHGHILSLTIGPEVRFPLTSHLQGFAVGGVGWIRRNIALTATTIQYVDSYDPFYGDLGPQPLANVQVLSSTTRTAFGGDFGGGVSLPLAALGVDLFVAVRYDYARTAPRVTAMVPVMFGVRWPVSSMKP